MNYSEAIAYIHSTYKFGSKLGLENIEKLLKLMGNPQDSLKFIHVAGTNGKGSTSAFIASALMSAGYSVGFFSSPFLEVFNERIRLDGKNIPDNDLAFITGYVKRKVDELLASGGTHPTEFEIVTAIAFEYYKNMNVDFVVLEVGMGGRLDSTNVIKHPLACVITPIDMDHTDYLGDTLEKIAYEKAGIIKMGTDVYFHPQKPDAHKAIVNVCEDLECRLTSFEESEISIEEVGIRGTRFKYNELQFEIALIGEHQTRNAVLAYRVLEGLREKRFVKISDEQIKEGFKETKWPGRLEILTENPLLIIDGAHNVHGAQSLANALGSIMSGRKIVGVVGMLSDKDIDGVLQLVLPHLDEVIVTEPNSPRKMSASDLAAIIENHGKNPIVVPSVLEAVLTARSMLQNDDCAVFFGSLYMIGDVRTMLVENYGG